MRAVLIGPTGSARSSLGDRYGLSLRTPRSTRPVSPTVSTDGWTHLPIEISGRRSRTTSTPADHGGEQSGADDEQLEDPEDPPDHERDEAAGGDRPSLAGGHVSGPRGRAPRRGPRRWRRPPTSARRDRSAGRGGAPTQALPRSSHRRASRSCGRGRPRRRAAAADSCSVARGERPSSIPGWRRLASARSTM